MTSALNRIPFAASADATSCAKQIAKLAAVTITECTERNGGGAILTARGEETVGCVGLAD